MRLKFAGLVTPVSRCGAVLFLFLSLGCSSSLFTGDISSDQKTSKTAINPACFGINLSQEALDVPSTRGLIRCLNANGAIPAYQSLLDSLSDAQVQSVADLINEEVLKNKRLLKDLDKSFAHMNQDGLLDETFAKAGRVLEHTKFITSAVKLFRDTTTQGTANGEKRIDEGLLKSVQILADEIGNGTEARKVVNNTLEFGMRLSSSQAYHQIAKGLKLPIWPSYPGLETLTKNSVEYIKAKINSDHALGKLLLWGIADKTLMGALDHLFYESCENTGSNTCSSKSDFLTIDQQVQSMDYFLRYLNPLKPLGSPSREEDTVGKLSHLYQVMDNSIECLDGTKEVTNADMYVMEEFLKQDPIRVPYWTLRENFLKLKAASSLCDYPSEFNELLSILKVLGDSVETGDNGQIISRRHLVTITHFLKALQVGGNSAMSSEAFADLSPYFFFSKTDKKDPSKKTILNYPANERYMRFLIQWLGDKDAVNFVNRMADAVAELSRKDRSILGNSLYLLNLASPGSADRENLSKATQFLMRVREQLKTADAVPGTDPAVKGRSVYDVFTKLLKNVDASVVYDLVVGMKDFIDSDEEFVAPFLNYGHRALWINDSTPFLDLILASARKANQYEPLFNTLIQISEMPQFEDAIRLTATMAQNGALKDLLQGILIIYRKSVETLPGEPALLSRPPVAAIDPSRDKSSQTQVAWNPAPAYWPAIGSIGMNACKAMDLDLGFADTGKPGWVDQLKSTASCVNAEGKYPEMIGLADYATDSSRTVKNGKSWGVFTADLLSSFFDLQRTVKLSKKKAYDEFSDMLIDPSDKADLKEYQRFMPFVLSNKYCSLYDKNAKFGDCPWNYERISVGQGLMRSLSLVRTAPAALQSLSDFGSWALLHQGVPRTVGLLYNTFNDADEAADCSTKIPDATIRPALVSKPLSAFPKNRALDDEMRKALKKVEGVPDSQIEAKLARKTWEYWNQVRAGDEVYTYRNSKEFKELLAPFLNELAKPNVLEWFLTFLYKFDSNPYDNAWVENWFHRISGNVRTIQYYYPGNYPGKQKPVVRFVNMIDLMELVVIDADFSLEEVKQALGELVQGFGSGTTDVFTIRYLARLALSGPDGSKYDMDHWLDEMKGELDFYSSMANDSSILGVTIQPEVKRRLFNLQQVFQVLPELRQHVSKTANGTVVNDLSFLRDMFRAVLSAMPKESWKKYDRNNSLSLVSAMIHFGVLRNVGLRLWNANEKGEVSPVPFEHVLKVLTESVYVKENKQYHLNENTLAVLRHLLSNDKRGEAKTFNDRYVFIGALVDRMFEWLKPDDSAKPGETQVKDILLRSAYNMSLVLDDLYTRAKGQGISFPALLTSVGQPFLATKTGTEFLGNNLDLLDDIVSDLKGVYFSKFLLDSKNDTHFNAQRGYAPNEAYSDVLTLGLDSLVKLNQNNAKVAQDAVTVAARLFPAENESSLRRTIDALRNMTEDPDYKALKKQSLERINQQVVRWFVNPGDEKVLPFWLRHYLAQHMKSNSTNDVSDLIAMGIFIGNESAGKSDRFYKEIQFLGEPRYVTAVQDFMDIVSSGISDIYHRATAFYTKTSK